MHEKSIGRECSDGKAGSSISKLKSLFICDLSLFSVNKKAGARPASFWGGCDA
jgi:hypothetical protein